MEIIGHLYAAEMSGIHAAHELYGEELIETMMPNILHCHDWAYRACWQPERAPPRLRATVRRLRSHIVADWLIHYGDRTTTEKRKCGWAYRRMRTASALAPRFFADAAARDLLRSDALLPARWDKKQRLDFNHSILEYALDLLWGDALLDRARTRDLCRALARLADRDVRRGYLALYAGLGAWSERPIAYRERSIDSIVDDAYRARHASDFAVRTTARKYGLKTDPAALTHVRGLLEAVAAAIDRADADALLARTAAAIADPDSLYTAPLAPSPPQSPAP
ncbi:hypothetical protein [Sphingomonas sp. 28-62-20]|uniref:hypothetical protein n=1 Tax=Sphingomonas sp. 28-62-20 TaxID=1970433 RepID=UPI002690D9E8